MRWTLVEVIGFEIGEPNAKKCINNNDDNNYNINNNDDNRHCNNSYTNNNNNDDDDNDDEDDGNNNSNDDENYKIMRVLSISLAVPVISAVFTTAIHPEAHGGNHK